MIEVRIRHEGEACSAHLGEVPFTQVGLDSVIPLLNQWGVEYADGDWVTLVGQIVLDATGAYFEIILVEDE